MAVEIAERYPELVERALFHDDLFDNDEVYVYLHRGITRKEAEVAYCTLVAFGGQDVAVSVWLHGGEDAMVFLGDC